jgi:hypothetical protein
MSFSCYTSNTFFATKPAPESTHFLFGEWIKCYCSTTLLTACNVSEMSSKDDILKHIFVWSKKINLVSEGRLVIRIT